MKNLVIYIPVYIIRTASRFPIICLQFFHIFSISAAMFCSNRDRNLDKVFTCHGILVSRRM